MNSIMSSVFSCEKYIQYHRQPHSQYMTMAEFNMANSTMMWDPQIESSIREQHKYSEEYQDFKLERTDLMSRLERLEYFKN